MRYLIAFDKFKDSMPADAACEVTADTLRDQYPDAETLLAPLTDGGEGFAHILTQAAEGKEEAVTVEDPLGRSCEAEFGVVELARLPGSARELLNLPGTGACAVIEMAQASGLQQLKQNERNVWQTSTHGTGETIRKLADQGVDAILLGIGGSATNDIGLGALAALGVEFRDANRRAVRPTPDNWDSIVQIDPAGMIPLPPLRIACDVNNPLLGPRGAAAVYGPQKGLLQGDLATMEAAMGRMAGLLCDAFGKERALIEEPASGAAGGIGFGLRVAGRDVRYVAGFELVMEWLQLQEKVDRANVIITGEGRFDESSLEGKGPGTLIHAASKASKPVHVFAGAVADDLNLPRHLPREQVHAITPPDYDLPKALREAPELLAQAVRQSGLGS